MRIIWGCVQRIFERRRERVGGSESDSTGQNQWGPQVPRTVVEGNRDYAVD